MTDLFRTTWQDLWGDAANAESVGVVYTRPEIVELILDLAGFVPDLKRLSRVRVLEPSCGDGAFVTAVVRRVLESETLHAGTVDWQTEALEGALTAADISIQAVENARAEVATLLSSYGCPISRATRLASAWVRHTDFLLESCGERFDLVVGNPPYVRIEALPREVLAAYRAEFETLTDRADLYVAFIQRGLELLTPEGRLAYICANRFAKNQYGAALRRLISSKYEVKLYLNLEHTQPFLSEVAAYPAILVAGRHRSEGTLAATLRDLTPATLHRVRQEANGAERSRGVLERFDVWYPHGTPWVATSNKERTELERLQVHPVLEDSAPLTKVGIGVATGADNVFILNALSPEIEESRQLPLAMPADARAVSVTWSGRYLLNPFADEDDGSLVDLSRFPLLRGYLAKYEEQLRARHVGKRAGSWFRTIDRVWPKLAKIPKLLIPDIQPGRVIALEDGNLYPHHNLYYVTSAEWPLCALQAILRSTLVFRQVTATSVQLRGGNVRYQAQSLRRVRIPKLAHLPAQTIDSLISVSASRDQREVDAVCESAYAQAFDHTVRR